MYWTLCLYFYDLIQAYVVDYSSCPLSTGTWIESRPLVRMLCNYVDCSRSVELSTKINGTETCNYLWNSLEFPSLRRKEELNCWGHNDQNYAIRNKTCKQTCCVNCFLLELFPLYSSILDKSCTLGVGLYWKREKSKRKVVRKFWLLHESLFVLAQTLTVTQVQFKLFLIVGTIVHLRTVNVTC